jgi:PIN domain nuclease of toxin-antitoxin system
MTFLLDTQITIWALLDDRRLSSQAREILSNRENEFSFSVCTLWEIAIKRGLKKPDFQYDPREIQRFLIRHGCEELAIQSEHVLKVESLPPIHKDPFDRILIAQAMVEGIILLTSDTVIAQYPGPIRLV